MIETIMTHKRCLLSLPKSADKMSQNDFYQKSMRGTPKYELCMLSRDADNIKMTIEYKGPYFYAYFGIFIFLMGRADHLY